jgi:acetyltransferase-like isoleucine patch superfamily enzyme
VESLIHPTAILEPGSQLGSGVRVGEFSIIRAGVEIGANSTIGAFCELGHGAQSNNSELRIGENSRIRSHSVIYLGSTFGPGLSTGHGVVIREGTSAGEGLSAGTSSDIQGDCKIGNFVRLHSNVHVSMKTTMGDYVWLYPGVVLTNDPRPPSDELKGTTIGDFAVVAVGVTVLPGVTVGRESLIAAGSVLTRDAEEGGLYSGNPARFRGPLSSLMSESDPRQHSYPWKLRFTRGYPQDIVDLWINGTNPK